MNIELELRGEIKIEDFNRILRLISRHGKFLSKTRRLSVMFFINKKDNSLDIRVRVTNGRCEVVLKHGAYHAGDRIEVSQPIRPDQFMGMVRIFSNMHVSDCKVGEREIFNYGFPGGIVVSLVKARSIAYLELEKLTNRARLKNDTETVRGLAERFGFTLFKSDREFLDLCRRLTLKSGDWNFRDTPEHYRKLSRLLNKYTDL